MHEIRDRRRRLRWRRAWGSRLRQARPPTTSSCSSETTTVGGTWWANTLPGLPAATSRRTSTRSRSRPTRTGRRRLPAQPQILQYLRDCADRFGRAPHLRLGCEAHRRTLGRASGSTGDRDVHRPAQGARPRSSPPGCSASRSSPALGLHRFQGNAFHSARVGPRRRPGGQARGGDRHRRERDPVRAGDRRPQVDRAARSSSGRRRGSSPQPDRDVDAAASEAVPRWCRPFQLARREPAVLDPDRTMRLRNHTPTRRVSEVAGLANAASPAPAGAATRPARAAHSRLRDLLQTDPPLEPVVPGD